jgi:hypothetical protein
VSKLSAVCMSVCTSCVGQQIPDLTAVRGKGDGAASWFPYGKSLRHGAHTASVQATAPQCRDWSLRVSRISQWRLMRLDPDNDGISAYRPPVYISASKLGGLRSGTVRIL